MTVPVLGVKVAEEDAGASVVQKMFSGRGTEVSWLLELKNFAVKVYVLPIQTGCIPETFFVPSYISTRVKGKTVFSSQETRKKENKINSKRNFFIKNSV